MDFYSFARIFFAWIATITCIPVVNAVLLFYCHRIREGQMAEDDERRLDSDELRTRAVYAAVALMVATPVFVFIDVVAARWLEIPVGPVHLVVLLAYVAACSLILTYFFAYEDFFAGFGLYVLAVGLPLIVLWPLDWLTHWIQPVLGLVLHWLQVIPPPVGY
ncbi:MAG TPA: hypothetical protein VHR72_01080 [Gemmataceae bacterium]|nr:hypothetical protein [Gemmataceae bacterium]